MRLWLLFVAAFSQAMSQLLSDESFEAVPPESQEVNWLASPLTPGFDSPGYLASQPDLTAQNNPLQSLPLQADSGNVTPEAHNDITITADGCVFPSPQTDPPPRIKRRSLRERQIACPAKPLTGSRSGSSATTTRQPSQKNRPSENPRLYPGGAKHIVTDWFFGATQEFKQCPPEKKTLCCTGAQEGLRVRTCTTFYLFPGSSIKSVNCFNGGIYCCDDLVISDKVINYVGGTAIFDRDGENCFPLFYRPP